jgi:hypothetical protein
LTETGKTHEILEIGYSPFDDSKKKKTPYTVSETRFIESLEGVCDKVMKMVKCGKLLISTSFKN